VENLNEVEGKGDRIGSSPFNSGKENASQVQALNDTDDDDAENVHAAIKPEKRAVCATGGGN